MELMDRFDHAFIAVREAMIVVAEMENNLVEAERMHSVARNRALLKYDVKDLGANEERRAARLAELTEMERRLVREATDLRNSARLRLDLAKLDLDGLKTTLRVFEAMTARVNVEMAR